jgi:hypothetical protein
MPQAAEDEEADKGVTQAPKSKHKRSSVARASILGDRVDYDLLYRRDMVLFARLHHNLAHHADLAVVSPYKPTNVIITRKLCELRSRKDFVIFVEKMSSNEFTNGSSSRRGSLWMLSLTKRSIKVIIRRRELRIFTDTASLLVHHNPSFFHAIEHPKNAKPSTLPVEARPANLGAPSTSNTSEATAAVLATSELLCLVIEAVPLEENVTDHPDCLSNPGIVVCYHNAPVVLP